MKITLDLTDLVAKGRITEAEAERLKGLAAQDTGALGVNILMAFGTIAVALGAGVIVPSPWTAIAVGALLFGVGLALTLAGENRWRLFSQVCMTIGALAVVGGISFVSEGNLAINLLTVLLLAAAAVVAQSGLLAALAVLDFSTLLGANPSYWHATYGLSIFQPTLSIASLTAVTLALYVVSLKLPKYERVAIIGARTAILMINAAFLVGSLFGDRTQYFQLSDVVFSIVWAVLLVGVGIWAVQANRRWVVNAAAVFGAIHFYTQWFEHLGASPFSILGGGVLLIAFGFALKALNDRRNAPAAAT